MNNEKTMLQGSKTERLQIIVLMQVIKYFDMLIKIL